MFDENICKNYYNINFFLIQKINFFLWIKKFISRLLLLGQDLPD